jgi:predicted nucleotidyltransferase
MIETLNKHSTEIAQLCTRFHVEKLEVFGSAARGSDFDPSHSDVDFAVQFRLLSPGQHFDAYFGLLEGLEKLLGTGVDLVELGAVKNAIFLKSVVQDKQALYVAA